MNHSTPEPSTPTPIIPLDDLPAGRLRDALALLDHMRRGRWLWLTVAPGTASYRVASDLARAGYVTIRPDSEAVFCRGPNTMRVELVRQGAAR